MSVQKLRLQRGWSQQQLAEMSGLSTRTIQRIENGQPASAESLKSLASVFETDFTQLTSEQDMATVTANPQAETPVFDTGRKTRGFYIHLTQYVLVITLLTVINLVTNPAKLWFFWPALGWGIGILAHAAATFKFMPFGGRKTSI